MEPPMKPLFLLLMLLLALPALAAPNRAASQTPATIQRIVTEEFPPYQIRQHGLHGWSVSLVRQLMDQAGIQYRIEVLPWARAYKEAQQSANVLIFSLLRTQERETEFSWIVPLCPMRISFYTAAHRHDVQVNNLADANRYMVGVENGQANYRFLREHGFSEQKNLLVVGHNHQLQQMLQLGRVDLMLVSDVFVANLPDKGAKLRRVFTAHALERYLYLAARHDADPALIQRIQAAWKTIKAKALPACQQVSAPPFQG